MDADLSDTALAWRALFLTLMALDRMKQGKPPDPWIEEKFQAVVAEVNKRKVDA